MVRFIRILGSLVGWAGLLAALTFTPARADAGSVVLVKAEVIKVGGLLDDATLRFVQGSIEKAALAQREVVVIQLNSAAVVGTQAELEATVGLLADPPVPVVVWLGPAPAVAGGGAAQLFAAARSRAAAPGSIIENWSPAVAGGTVDLIPEPAGLTERQIVTGPIPGLVDLVVPSIRQLVQRLNGMSVEVGGVIRTLDTITDQVPGTEAATGVTTIPVSFTQPGLFHRFLHVAARPDAAFFFLVAGLTLAAFEFFALGPGLGAVLAGLCLLLSGYGMAVLPTRWVAVAVTAFAIGLFTVSNQKGGIIGLGLPATVLLAWGGFNFATGAPQVRPGIPGVMFSILAVLFFFLLAIPTVGRARFSTQTIGRTGLIGRRGTAVADFSPDGVVEIDGARWPATAHREAGIRVGSPVVVTSVEGARVEVDQAEAAPPGLMQDREN